MGIGLDADVPPLDAAQCIPLFGSRFDLVDGIVEETLGDFLGLGLARLGSSGDNDCGLPQSVRGRYDVPATCGPWGPADGR